MATTQSSNLAAIMFTDIVGYSTLMHQNEKLAFDLLQEHRSIVRARIKEFRGREIDTAGDGFVVKFNSTLDAVQCALEIQKDFVARNASGPKERAIRLRIGIHVSDVIESNVDSKAGVYGDGVNIAARLQPLAPAGGLCISGAVYEQIAGKVECSIRSLGRPALKGIGRKIRLYAVELNPPHFLTRTNQIVRQRRHLRMLALAVTFVVVGMSISVRFATLPSTPELRVAILPLDTSGLSQDDLYIPEGLVNALISNLSKGGIHVLEKDSAAALKKSHKSPTEIARELKIDRLLTGSLTKTGNSLKLDISLIDTQSQEVIWSQDFQRPATEILELKNLAARELLDRFKAQRSLASIEPLDNYTTSEKKQAYLAYLKGQFLMARRTKEGFKGAADQFEKAIALDPQFAPAYAELAITCELEDWYGVRPPVEGAVKIVQYASKALALNPNLTEALLVLAEEKVYLENDFVKGEELYKKALLTNPQHTMTHQWYGEFLAYRGRVRESYAETDKAVDLDPLSTIANVAQGSMRYFGRDPNAAIAILEKTIKMDPTFMLSYYWLGRALLQKKDFASGIKALKQAVELSGHEPMIVSALAYAYAVSGDEESADHLHSELEAAAKSRYVSPYFLAKLELARGQEKAAGELLRRSIIEHDDQSVTALVDPELDALRKTAVFKDAIAPMKIEQ